MYNRRSPRPTLSFTVAGLLFAAGLMMIGACGLSAPAVDGLNGEGSNMDADISVVEESPEQPAEEAEAPQAAVSAPLSGVDPCALLTEADVENAFGEPMGSLERETIFNYESCNFQNESGSKFIILQLTQQNAAQFKKDNEETSEMFEAELLPVDDLGDEAAFYSGLLRVRVGETVLQIATWHTDAEQEQALAMTQELARSALSRLP